MVRCHAYQLVVSVVILWCTKSVCPQQWSYVIHVDHNTGDDIEQCLTNSSDSIACATLQYAVSGLENSSQILLASGTHHIENTINITDVHDISLAGDNASPGSVVVSCVNSSDAGLKFVSVSDLYISNIKFVNCGSLSESTTRAEDYNSMALFRTVVYVLNSTNVLVESTAFSDNRGVGLALFDTNGLVIVMNSNFTSNRVPPDERMAYNGGGGLYFEHTYCSPGKLTCHFQDNPYSGLSFFNVSNCNFFDNHATSLPGRSSTLVHQEKTSSRRLGHGAGISLSLKGGSSDNFITVSNCTFESNSARYGGALNVNYQDYVQRNTLLVQNCQFISNTARDGGGGLFVGIFFYERDTVLGNEVNLDRTMFIDNTGKYGGGAHYAISQMLNSDSLQNSLSFSDCEWRGNSAVMGGALVLVPEAWNTYTDGHLPIPVFTRCLFYNNSIIDGDGFSDSVQATEGVIFSSAISMNFSKRVDFIENYGTAVSITGGSINVLNNTRAIFRDNFGTRGGALALLEFSSLRLFPSSSISFVNNTATEFGGAIYVSSHNELDFYFSRSCFIRYSDIRVPTHEWDTSITFYYNFAGLSRPPFPPLYEEKPSILFNPRYQHEPFEELDGTKGHSIFAVSVLPCIRASDTTGNFTPTDKHAFPKNIFHFYEYCSEDLCGIGTTPASLVVRGLDSDGVLRMAPGEMKQIFLEAEDELNHTVYPVVTAFVSPSTLFHVDNSSYYVTDDRVQINGAINRSFELTLRTAEPKQVSLTVNGKLIDCPPGLVYESNCSSADYTNCSASEFHESKCVCSATTAYQRYEGITKCSVNEFRGLLNIGYWAGCYGVNKTLLTAECPLGYCRFGDTFSAKPFHILPGTCRELDSYLCGSQNREGVVCGKCIANHSIFFHSQRYNCHVCKYKYLGFLFYILSEILPVTVVFLCIISFNIHLTSGAWNSVILYAQIIDLYEVNSLQLFQLPPVILQLTSVYQFIFGSFNFDFFKFDDYLSFCIWDRATVLDVLAFKYVTTAFAVLLLLALVLCFRSQCWSRCQHVWEQCQVATGSSKHHRGWIIHGISAFLVLSYAQCAKVSFQILSYIQLYGKNHIAVKKVVFLSGDTDYFSVDHLPYVIPALLILILTTLPPIVLLLYPTGIQLINVCIGERNLEKFRQHFSEEGRCGQAVSMTRFKPLIDSFQGCYKDHCRYFAGLLFLYRFLMSLSFALSTNAVTLYISLEVLVIIMLAFHACAQPYQHRFFNLLDMFMYANLAIVNSLSLFNYYWVNYSTDTADLTISLVFQLILIYLPVLYLLIMCLLFNLTGCSRKLRHSFYKMNSYIPLFEESAEDIELEDSLIQNEIINNSRTGSIPFDEDHLPYRLFEDHEHTKTDK